MNTTKLVIIGMVAAIAVGSFATEAKKPLIINYPAPAHEGTPRPFHISNLEPLRERAPELLVPPETALLSRGKPVSASDTLPVIGQLSDVTDGDNSGVDGTVLELGPGPQWVQIDLGAPARVSAVAIWHYHAEKRVYHDVVVQISDRASFERNVVTIYNNDDDNSLKLGRGSDRPYIETKFGRLIDAKGAAGRYVRLYSNGNTSDELNQYCEVQVFGTGVGAAPRHASAATTARPEPTMQ